MNREGQGTLLSPFALSLNRRERAFPEEGQTLARSPLADYRTTVPRRPVKARTISRRMTAPTKATRIDHTLMPVVPI